MILAEKLDGKKVGRMSIKRWTNSDTLLRVRYTDRGCDFEEIVCAPDELIAFCRAVVAVADEAEGSEK